MVHMEAWLNKVDEIAAEQPTYRLGGKADDGTCDCIGLIIGALNRCGVKWPGIHGSNWAARNAMAWLLPVSDASDLDVGDIVYKARRPGETGYSLPDRYAADPDNAPTLWEDIAYRQGYRIIPATITAGAAFDQGECGWWGDVLYKSLIASNVWTPDAYPAGWEAVQ